MTDVARLLESRRARLGRWAGAALVVCGVHIASATLAVMQWPEEEAEETAGAITMDLAPLPVAARVDSPDVAHGPLMQEAMPTLEAARDVVQEVEDVIPPVEPSPAPDPEVALPKPQPEQEEQPKEEEPREEAPQKETPAEVQAAQLTTAPPRVDAEAPPVSAPSPGQSASLARVQATWVKALVRHLERFPEGARSLRTEGTVVVAFTLDRSGQVVVSRVTKSSGSALLDEEAVEVLKRASPLPAPPPEIAGPFDLSLPILFRIR
jgi:protein TonB